MAQTRVVLLLCVSKARISCHKTSWNLSKFQGKTHSQLSQSFHLSQLDRSHPILTTSSIFQILNIQLRQPQDVAHNHAFDIKMTLYYSIVFALLCFEMSMFMVLIVRTDFNGTCHETYQY